mmetsp:Transcript_21209/g.41284  ORF Transcript_21209/g.41284 Transcript_21209/m.41284 type:complete len:201 (-) Transcript_21209:1040-1642(-)
MPTTCLVPSTPSPPPPSAPLRRPLLGRSPRWPARPGWTSRRLRLPPPSSLWLSHPRTRPSTRPASPRPPPRPACSPSCSRRSHSTTTRRRPRPAMVRWTLSSQRGRSPRTRRGPRLSLWRRRAPRRSPSGPSRNPPSGTRYLTLARTRAGPTMVTCMCLAGPSRGTHSARWWVGRMGSSSAMRCPFWARAPGSRFPSRGR